MLSGYITTLKNKQKLDVSSEGPSSKCDDNKVKKCFDISDKRNTGVMYVDFF